jgi:hypothetical protein
MEKDGFFPLLIGGLGNQMFILVAAWVCGRVYNCPVYLPSSASFKNPHFNSKKDYIQTLFQPFGQIVPFSEHNLRSSHIAHYKHYKPNGFGPWYPHETTPGTHMDSYFQFYPPLAPYEKEIRSLFLQTLQPSCDTSTAFLHIRRGDYLKLPDFHYIQPMSYYENAVKQLLEKNPCVKRIHIFTDDVAWAKEQPFFSNQPNLFSFIEQEDEVEALKEMASCHGGAILANSTFSWWGAFLGAYSVRAPIFYPSRWIATDVPELCPREWICL